MKDIGVGDEIPHDGTLRCTIRFQREHISDMMWQIVTLQAKREENMTTWNAKRATLIAEMDRMIVERATLIAS